VPTKNLCGHFSGCGDVPGEQFADAIDCPRRNALLSFLPAASTSATPPQSAQSRPAPRRCRSVAGRRSPTTCESHRRPLVSCAVIRTRWPSLRTLPSRIVPRFSFSPTVRRSSVLPLNWKEEVRAATRNPGILARSLSSSSDRPSEKYSCSLSELMFTKGSTAIEGVLGCAAVVPGRGLPRPSQKAVVSAATSKTANGIRTFQRLPPRAAEVADAGAATDDDAESTAG